MAAACLCVLQVLRNVLIPIWSLVVTRDMKGDNLTCIVRENDTLPAESPVYTMHPNCK